MLALHLSGSPLTTTQRELTFAQRVFLIAALDEKHRLEQEAIAAASRRK